MAHGVSIESGIRKARCVHLRGELPAIRPDFSPYTLLFEQHQHAIRLLNKLNSSAAAEPMIQKVARKSERIANREWVIVRLYMVGTIRGTLDRVVALECCLASGSERRVRAHLNFD